MTVYDEINQYIVCTVFSDNTLIRELWTSLIKFKCVSCWHHLENKEKQSATGPVMVLFYALYPSLLHSKRTKWRSSAAWTEREGRIFMPRGLELQCARASCRKGLMMSASTRVSCFHGCWSEVKLLNILGCCGVYWLGIKCRLHISLVKTKARKQCFFSSSRSISCIWRESNLSSK